MLGDKGLQEITYTDIEDKKEIRVRHHQWLARHHRQILGGGAAARHRRATCKARFSGGTLGTAKTYQTDYLLDAQTIAPGATGTADARLFAGAKEVASSTTTRRRSSSTASTC